jgi:hypothetical protein
MSANRDDIPPLGTNIKECVSQFRALQSYRADLLNVSALEIALNYIVTTDDINDEAKYLFTPLLTQLRSTTVSALVLGNGFGELQLSEIMTIPPPISPPRVVPTEVAIDDPSKIPDIVIRPTIDQSTEIAVARKYNEKGLIKYQVHRALVRDLIQVCAWMYETDESTVRNRALSTCSDDSWRDPLVRTVQDACFGVSYAIDNLISYMNQCNPSEYERFKNGVAFRIPKPKSVDLAQREESFDMYCMELLKSILTLQFALPSFVASTGVVAETRFNRPSFRDQDMRDLWIGIIEKIEHAIWLTIFDTLFVNSLIEEGYKLYQPNGLTNAVRSDDIQLAQSLFTADRLPAFEKIISESVASFDESIEFIDVRAPPKSKDRPDRKSPPVKRRIVVDFALINQANCGISRQFWIPEYPTDEFIDFKYEKLFARRWDNRHTPGFHHLMLLEADERRPIDRKLALICYSNSLNKMAANIGTILSVARSEDEVVMVRKLPRDNDYLPFTERYLEDDESFISWPTIRSRLEKINLDTLDPLRSKFPAIDNSDSIEFEKKEVTVLHASMVCQIDFVTKTINENSKTQAIVSDVKEGKMTVNSMSSLGEAIENAVASTLEFVSADTITNLDVLGKVYNEYLMAAEGIRKLGNITDFPVRGVYTVTTRVLDACSFVLSKTAITMRNNWRIIDSSLRSLLFMWRDLHDRAERSLEIDNRLVSFSDIHTDARHFKYHEKTLVDVLKALQPFIRDFEEWLRKPIHWNERTGIIKTIDFLYSNFKSSRALIQLHMSVLSKLTDFSMRADDSAYKVAIESKELFGAICFAQPTKNTLDIYNHLDREGVTYFIPTDAPELKREYPMVIVGGTDPSVIGELDQNAIFDQYQRNAFYIDRDGNWSIRYVGWKDWFPIPAERAPYLWKTIIRETIETYDKIEEGMS